MEYLRGLLGRILFVWFASMVLVCAHAQVKRPVQAVETTTPPAIDGILNDPAWNAAPRASGFLDVVTGGPADEQTTVSILYDANFIYLAFDCRDTHPEGIVARDTVRDSKFQKQGDRETEDNVEVDFDPYLTHSGADLSRFSVNPLGTRSAQLAGGRGQKEEWNGQWEAAAKRTDTGWTAEMRIPWAGLNYPTNQQTLTFGINFYRYIDRTKRLYEWSHVGLNQLLLENEGLWVGVKTPRGAFRPKLSVLPYVLGGLSNRGLAGKAGADMRYPFTPQLTGVATIFPDFSGLESAVKTIAYSSTEIFLPEYRPFFLEGGEEFDIPWMANSFDTLFYSRRIDRFDIGGKVYGRLSPKDEIGFLETNDPGRRNDLVFRYSRNVGETAKIGGMVVRKDAADDENTLSAINGEFRRGKFGVDAMAANSAGPGAGGGLQATSIVYEDKIVTTILHMSSTSDNFLAPDSFIPIKGYKGYWYTNMFRYDWAKGPFTGAQLAFNSVDFRRFNSGQYDRELTASAQLNTRNDWSYKALLSDVRFEGLDDRFVDLSVTKGYHNRFQSIGLEVLTGETGSVPTTFIAPTVKLRVLKKLDVLYAGAIQNRDGVQQQHILTLNYEVSPTRSFGGRVVLQDGDTNAYGFYRNSGGKGTEYYLVVGDPNAKRTVNQVQLKVVFAF